MPNQTYYLMGGVVAHNLRKVTIQIDGTLKFSRRLSYWPRTGDGPRASVLPCLYFDGLADVVFTSESAGTLDGQGAAWWGIPGIGYLVRGENRPRLFHAAGNPTNVLVENLRFIDSPYWTFYVDSVDGLEVRGCHIDARRRKSATTHNIYEMTAFNTDGYDVTGKNVWIHDSSVWCQDDGVAVKDGSENMLFERMEVSGVGLTIGSIGNSTVRNVTFRDVRSVNPYKGIYLKFRPGPRGRVPSSASSPLSLGRSVRVLAAVSRQICVVAVGFPRRRRGGAATPPPRRNRSTAAAAPRPSTATRRLDPPPRRNRSTAAVSLRGFSSV